MLPMSERVDFVVAGAQKAGTTALDIYLRTHPEICMARVKEVHFFDKEAYFSPGPPPYEQYHAQFDPGPHHRSVGEITPIYMYWSDAPRRIWEYNPDMKVLVVLRNPIERAFSHWNMERSRGNESLGFLEAIKQERSRSRSALPFQHPVFSYLDRGFYTEQLRRLWRYFPETQVLVLKHEDLLHQPRKVFQQICAFLGVSSLLNVDLKRAHSRPYHRRMSRGEWEFLRNVFEFEIRSLERLLDWDLDPWLKPPPELGD